jgi:hypothetical protein
MAKAFVKGGAVALAGPVRDRRRRRRARWCTRATSPPSWRPVAPAGLGLRPRYAAIEGVKGATLAVVRASALRGAGAGHGGAAAAAAARAAGAAALADSFRRLHGPRDARTSPATSVARARRRIALETLFVTQVAFSAAAGGGGRGGAVGAAAARRRARGWRRRSGSR